MEAVEEDAAIPITARVHLGHAVVEHLALGAGVDLLHIKGPALLPGLRRSGRGSTDADVLVAPGHLEAFETELTRHGWERRSDYDSGSAFQHASNWFHDNWGYVDVHAHWPGPHAPAREVFAAFAEGGLTQDIAHVPCRVPHRTAQILILVLHVARSVDNQRDLELAWHASTPEEQDQVRALAVRLRAQTAFAAGIGELDSVVGDRTADLWRFYSEGGSRLDEWRARLRAAAGPREAIRVVTGAVGVNRDYLRMELGHEPSRRELVARQWQRVRVLSREVGRATASAVRRRTKGGRG